MFITTPFVRFTVSRLYATGKIDKQQMELLMAKENSINTITTTALLIAIYGFAYSYFGS